jgi:hypothetical protein
MDVNRGKSRRQRYSLDVPVKCTTDYHRSCEMATVPVKCTNPLIRRFVSPTYLVWVKQTHEHIYVASRSPAPRRRKQTGLALGSRHAKIMRPEKCTDTSLTGFPGSVSTMGLQYMVLLGPRHRFNQKHKQKHTDEGGLGTGGDTGSRHAKINHP